MYGEDVGDCTWKITTAKSWPKSMGWWLKMCLSFFHVQCRAFIETTAILTVKTLEANINGKPEKNMIACVVPLLGKIIYVSLQTDWANEIFRWLCYQTFMNSQCLLSLPANLCLLFSDFGVPESSGLLLLCKSVKRNCKWTSTGHFHFRSEKVN